MHGHNAVSNWLYCPAVDLTGKMWTYSICHIYAKSRVQKKSRRVAALVFKMGLSKSSDVVPEFKVGG